MRFNSFLLALVLVGASACAQAGPVIHLDRGECELGEVWYGDTKSCQVGVTNKGDTDLEISEVHTSCGCTRAEVEHRRLEPGQRTTLTISFDATGMSAGRKTQTAFIRSNDPDRAEASVRVFATVVQQVQVEPLRVTARIKTFGERLSFPMRVANVSDRPVTLTVASSRGSVTDAAMKPDAVAVEAGQSAAFTLEARLTGASGAKFYRGAVILKSTHPKEHTIVVPVFIRVEASS